MDIFIIKCVFAVAIRTKIKKEDLKIQELYSFIN